MTHVSVPLEGCRVSALGVFPAQQPGSHKRTGTFPECRAGFESLLCPWLNPPVRVGLETAAYVTRLQGRLNVPICTEPLKQSPQVGSTVAPEGLDLSSPLPCVVEQETRWGQALC